MAPSRLLAAALALVLPIPAALHAAVLRGDYDARVELTELSPVAPSPAQRAAARELRRRLPGLMARYDAATGATRTLGNAVGYLTEPLPGVDAETAALAFLRANPDLLGLTAADLDGYEVTDRVTSRVSGTTHLYLRQTHHGLAVYNGQLQVHLGREGRLLSIYNAFLPELASAVPTTEPAIGAADAVVAALEHLGLAAGATPRVLGSGDGPQRATAVDHEGVSAEPIEARLMLLPIRRGEARLVWVFPLHSLEEPGVWEFTVDAVTGEVWTRVSWLDWDDYTVYPLPVESPIHTTPAPPADARVPVTDPADLTASPFGWHDTDGAAGAEFTIPRGNNVHAYEDRDADNFPPATEPDCGSPIDCTFPIDLTMDPVAYTDAAVAELFYWNNIIHDVQYQYGFDEAGGNFQVNNYGNGGTGGDDVRAEAQDGSGLNNANFLTLPEGQRPRMQMFEFTITSPRRDGDFDHGIVVHEFGHGISNRMVGGPANISCLNNLQQPGEGFSDWWALAYTAEVGDAGTDVRGSGTYVLGQPPDGPGVRPQPYSTDPAVNTWTYESIAGMSIPHGVGAVWAQAAWEVYWALVDHHGFDPDLYDPLGGGGNQRMMLYVGEAMQTMACSPSFLDVRDAILQAATVNYGGEDVCRMWTAFAGFGLGEDASTPGPNSTSATNGFAVPAACLTVHADGFESGDCSAWSSDTGGC